MAAGFFNSQPIHPHGCEHGFSQGSCGKCCPEGSPFLDTKFPEHGFSTLPADLNENAFAIRWNSDAPAFEDDDLGSLARTLTSETLDWLKSRGRISSADADKDGDDYNTFIRDLLLRSGARICKDREAALETFTFNPPKKSLHSIFARERKHDQFLGASFDWDRGEFADGATSVADDDRSDVGGEPEECDPSPSNSVDLEWVDIHPDRPEVAKQFAESRLATFIQHPCKQIVQLIMDYINPGRLSRNKHGDAPRSATWWPKDVPAITSVSRLDRSQRLQWLAATIFAPLNDLERCDQILATLGKQMKWVEMLRDATKDIDYKIGHSRQGTRRRDPSQRDDTTPEEVEDRKKALDQILRVAENAEEIARGNADPSSIAVPLLPQRLRKKYLSAQRSKQKADRPKVSRAKSGRPRPHVKGRRAFQATSLSPDRGGWRSRVSQKWAKTHSPPRQARHARRRRTVREKPQETKEPPATQDWMSLGHEHSDRTQSFTQHDVVDLVTPSPSFKRLAPSLPIPDSHAPTPNTSFSSDGMELDTQSVSSYMTAPAQVPQRSRGSEPVPIHHDTQGSRGMLFPSSGPLEVKLAPDQQFEVPTFNTHALRYPVLSQYFAEQDSNKGPGWASYPYGFSHDGRYSSFPL